MPLSNPDLEAAILANPDDLASYLVYADWLQSHGDPRGELISVQHARLSADTPALTKREEQLMKAQGGVFFGGLEKLLETDGGLSVTWRLGFLKSARVAREQYDSDLEDLLATKGLPQLEELGLVNCSFISGNVDALAKAKVLRQLKRLDLSMGFLTDEDAEAVVRHAVAFKHLELDVSHNYLTRRGVWLLQKAARVLVSTDQQAADTDDDRYVAVGE